MRPRNNLIGKRFGRLLVVGSEYPFCKCVCDCGNLKVTNCSNLVRGGTKSCGCLQKELNLLRNKIHGMTGTPEYKSWDGAKQRCYNVKDKHYRLYGARGITVCDNWRYSFENFYNDMGPKPSNMHTLDRIETDGNYSKSNCRWATPKEQSNNKNNNTKIEYNGKTMSLTMWAGEYGILRETLRSRIFKMKWPLNEALEIKAGGIRHKYKNINN